jgi:hypothetical protein
MMTLSEGQIANGTRFPYWSEELSYAEAVCKPSTRYRYLTVSGHAVLQPAGQRRDRHTNAVGRRKAET